jgi:hypothetical protein
VIAGDRETVALGGLIQKRDEKRENKIPWFGDLPAVGALFRYRTQLKEKRELLVILTPHIVRNKADAARILAEESRRMDWVLADVIKTHGSHGMAPMFPTVSGDGPRCGPVGGPVAPPLGLGQVPLTMPPAGPVPLGPVPQAPLPGGAVPELPVLPPASQGPGQATAPPPPKAVLPASATSPAAPPPGTPQPPRPQPPRPGPAMPTAQPLMPTPQTLPPGMAQGSQPPPPAAKPPDQGKESERWNLFKRN